MFVNFFCRHCNRMKVWKRPLQKCHKRNPPPTPFFFVHLFPSFSPSLRTPFRRKRKRASDEGFRNKKREAADLKYGFVRQSKIVDVHICYCDNASNICTRFGGKKSGSKRPDAKSFMDAKRGKLKFQLFIRLNLNGRKKEIHIWILPVLSLFFCGLISCFLLSQHIR